MRRRVLPAVALAGACAVAAAPMASWAEAGASAAATDARAWDLRAWLARLQEAPRTVNYEGTFVASAGGQMASARVFHVCEGAERYERIDSLDGEPRRVVRHNDRVSVLWPRLRLVTIDPPMAAPGFPALLAVAEERIGASYRPRWLREDRVAGREAEVVELEPRDDKRYGFRVWTDRPTGLLLRAEVRDARGEVLQSSSFIDVRIGFTPAADDRAAFADRFEGFQVRRAEVVETSLAAEGLVLEAPVEGFRPARCVRRALDPSQSAAVGDVVQAVYTDGLTYVSVFVERYDAARHAGAVGATRGATHTLSQRQGDRWITAVGDVPPATLQAFVAALRPLR